MTDDVSDDDDDEDEDEDLESKSVDSMANRKRKLCTILGTNKRMHMDKHDTEFDSDSNQGNSDHQTSAIDNEDGASSRMSDFDDGKPLKIHFKNDFFFNFVLLFVCSYNVYYD